MALSTLQLTIAAEKSVQAASKAVAPLKLFATSFSAAEASKGNVIRVPVFNVGEAAAFNVDSNNYCGSTQDVAGVDVTLDQHLVKSVYFDDRDFAECEVDFFAGAGEGIGRVLSRGIVDGAMALLVKANITDEHVFTVANAKTKDVVANLYAVADSNGLNPADCVLVVKPTVFANLLSILDASAYGGRDAILAGLIPGLFGFKGVFPCNSLSTAAGEKLNGVILPSETLGIASRVLRVASPSAYEEIGTKTDEATGLTFGFRRFGNACTGRNYIAGEVLAGFKILQDAGVRLVESAT